MRRNILFNNKANEVTLEAVARKEVPYYIRRKLTGSNVSYIQKKRDGRCICYAIVEDYYYFYEIHTEDESIAGYKEAERRYVSPYIRRKLKEAGTYIRRNHGAVFGYRLIDGAIYIAEIKLVIEEKEDIYSLMNGKDIYSRLSGVQVVFVRSIVDDHYAIKGGVFCDGLNFIDNIEEADDDISQMVCNFKDGGGCNMEDFYAMYGAYEKGSAFLDNIKNLIRDRDVNEAA